MRRHLPLYLVLASILFGSGCNRDFSSGQNEPELVFRLASEMNSNTELWQASHLFKEELEKASPKDSITKGEIKVEFYDQGTIGTEQQLLEACYFDVVEVVQINTSVVTTVEPSYSILNLPYLFVNADHLKSVLYGKIGQQMLNKLRNHGLQGLGFYSGGFRNMFYKADQCAETPQQLSDLKIRVMESPIMIKAINAIGPSATPIPFSELYQSIRTGVVDGAENSANIFVSYKYYEAGINCFTLTEHSSDQHVLIANADWLDSIKPKYRNRILEVAKSIVPKYNHIWEQAVRQATLEMKKEGVTVNQVKDKHAFIKRVKAIPQNFFDTHPGVSRKLFDEIEDEAQKYL